MMATTRCSKSSRCSIDLRDWRARKRLPKRYGELLASSTRAVTAVAAVVWTRHAGGPWQVEHQLQLDELELDASAAQRDAHQRMLLAVASSGAGLIAAPQFDRAGSHAEANENLSPYLLVLAPVMVDGEPVALLELAQRAGSSPAARRGYLRLLETLAEIAGDFHRATRLRELTAAQDQWRQWAQFARRIHRSLDPRQTAYVLVNEARRLIECDRVCLLIRRRRKLQLQAVSGTESFDPRANFTRGVERLVGAALAVGEPLWIADDWRGLPPEIETPLQAYLDECHARSVAILPLEHEDGATGEKEIIGALLIEQFHAGLNAALRRRAEAVGLQATAALGNALEVERLPLARLSRGLAKVRWLATGRRLPRALTVGALLLAVLGALIVWPAELRISARGELRPAMRREVFAPLDGVVERLTARHGQQVEIDQVLAVLRSPELELQQRRVEGERQTALKRLEALAAGRVGKRFTTEEELREYRRLSAEEEEVKAELAGLSAQQAILEHQAAALTVKSPIAGEVLTWNPGELLTARPVARGQTLLTIAQTDGPWVLEVPLPDEQSGHVLESFQRAQSSGKQVAVEYMLATRPGEKLRGHLEAIAESTEADRDNRPSVRLTIALDDGQQSELRPGATAVAKIDCGQRSVGYVWLHDLIDTARGWLFF